MLEFITFLLAPIAYAGLAVAAVQSARGRPVPLLRRSVALVALAHVSLVWTVRYGGQLSVATRNGYAGFLLFHTALVAIVASAFVAERVTRPLLLAAFGVVTLGALGAVFLYEVVAIYRIPVILTAIGGSVGLVRSFRARRTETSVWTS